MSEKKEEVIVVESGPVTIHPPPSMPRLRVALPHGVAVDIVREKGGLVSIEVTVPKGDEPHTTLSMTWVDLSLYPPEPEEVQPFRVQSFSD